MSYFVVQLMMIYLKLVRDVVVKLWS